MNRLLSLASWLAIGSQLLSCHHEVSPELPAETMTGKGTFGCLVNGKVWLPGGYVSVLGFGKLHNLEVMTGLNPNGKTTYLSVYAQINQGEKWISFFKTGISQIGTYKLGGDSSSSVSYRDEDLPTGCRNFYTDRDRSDQQIIEGKLTLTRYDAVVAGRFSFLLVQPNCDTIRVTEGRFDR